MKNFLSIMLFTIPVFSFAQNVGIATNTPANRLHIVHADAVGLRMDNPSAANSQIHFITQGTPRGFVGYLNGSLEFLGAANTPVRLGADLKSHFIISTTGNINIGNNASPAERLVISNGNLLLQNANKGIMLNGSDHPFITRGFDLFTSGSYTGLGRWGMFMEPSLLTFGIPNIAGKGFQFKSYEANSTGQSILTIDRIGQIKRPATSHADLLPVCMGVIDWNSTVISGTGNYTCTYGGAVGITDITIQDHFYDEIGYLAIATPLMYNSANGDQVGRVAITYTITGKLRVYSYLGNSIAGRPFSFVVYKLNL